MEIVGGRCGECALPFDKQFCVGWRRGVLKELINGYTFEAKRAAYFDLAELLWVRLGDCSGVKIVPVPTIGRHVRERGFDHIGKICRQLAALSGGKYVELLGRNKNTTQVGASMEKRILQAKEAFCVRKEKELGGRILLVDDVWTTGSSMKSACELLKANGACEISVALLAKSG